MLRAIDQKPEQETLAYIGLGANLGDCLKTLRCAIEAIREFPLTRLVASSHFYLTQPVDAPGPDYTNAVVSVRTALSAIDLLHALQRVEREFKRERPVGQHNAPRTLDLDLLCFGALRSTEPELLLPHPRMTERAFVLVPLREIVSADFRIGGQAIDQYLPKVSTQKLHRLDQEPIPDFVRS